MNFSFNLNKIKININAKKCDFFNKFRGLMFRKKQKSPILLFEFKKPVNIKFHSFFVFFDFLIVFLDDKNNVLEIKKIKPFCFSINSSKKFSKVLEIPFSKKYSRLLGLLIDEKRKI